MRIASGAGRRAATVATLLAILLTMPGAPGAAPPVASGLCATLASGDASAPRLAIFSAFPAEIAPLIAAATVEQAVTVEGREYDLGTLRGVRVVLGLLGIGMVNATNRSTSVLSNFDVAGVIVSGVAGTAPQRIGDVLVPTNWILAAGGGPFPVNPAMLALARLAARTPTLQHCTQVPPDPVAVCLTYEPAVLVGGRGSTDDPSGGKPIPCIAGTDDLFSCGLPALAVAPDTVEANDMETASVASVASTRNVPYIAFRAASDNEDFSQFPDYYRLAARNEAAATIAFLDRFARLGSHHAAARHVCALLARQRWNAAARVLRHHPGLTRPRAS